MKKLIDDPLAVAEDMVAGIVRADQRLALLPAFNVVVQRDYPDLAQAGKVALISGGGSGHEPAHAGYVGKGMLTAAVAGPVFTSPSVDAVLAAIRLVGGEAGVLLIVKNYTGDRLNFGLAAEIAKAEGIPVEMVIVGDDVAIDGDDGRVGRRGIAGTVMIHKIAGAAAEAGGTLEAVKAEAEAAAANLFSMGLGLSACTVPAAGEPGFTLGADEVEYGLGIHGESGVRREQIRPAKAMVATLIERIVSKGGLSRGDRVALMVNNLGGSAAQEMDIVARHAIDGLAVRGIVPATAQVGTFLTALEMAGCSLSLLRVDDAVLSRLLAPTDASAWSIPTVPGSPRLIDVPKDAGAQTLSSGPAWASSAETERFRAAILAVTAALRNAEDELTRLDSVVGDGDIGISLARGARAVEDALSEIDIEHPALALHQVSAILRRVLGGTSGPLYAVFVLRTATALAQASSASDGADWARAFQAGCEGMIDLGKARPGDRTMLDALLPAAAALSDADATGEGAAALAQSASAAAKRGAEATRDMQPRLGRSSYLGDRALGHVDPGAFAVTVWLDAIAASLAEAAAIAE